VRTQSKEAEASHLGLGGEGMDWAEPSTFVSAPAPLSMPTFNNESRNAIKHSNYNPTTNTQRKTHKLIQKQKHQNRILLDLRSKNTKQNTTNTHTSNTHTITTTRTYNHQQQHNNTQSHIHSITSNTQSKHRKRKLTHTHTHTTHQTKKRKGRFLNKWNSKKRKIIRQLALEGSPSGSAGQPWMLASCGDQEDHANLIKLTKSETQKEEYEARQNSRKKQ